MALKSFVINNSNKFFAKIHDYEELKEWMGKTSDKFFTSSVCAWVFAVIFFKINPVFWVLLILGIFLYLLSGLFCYYADFVKRIEPTIIKNQKYLLGEKPIQIKKILMFGLRFLLVCLIHHF